MSKKDEVINSIKGFNQDMTCRGFQFEPGKAYEHDGEAVACESGFHAIEGYPLEVLKYYPPATSRYFHVEQSGQFARHSGDSKVASTGLKIGVELSLAGLIKLAIEYTTSRCKPIDPKSPAWSEDENGAATASGPRGAATASGRHSAAMASGFYGKAKGVEGAALFLVYRDENSDGDDYGQILHAKAAIVGKDGIKPDVWYSLNADGEIVEAA